jgi:hypothetical protein
MSLMAPLKILSSPKCKAWTKFRRAAYGLYASKKFFTQRSSWDEIRIFRGASAVAQVLLKSLHHTHLRQDFCHKHAKATLHKNLERIAIPLDDQKTVAKWLVSERSGT